MKALKKFAALAVSAIMIFSLTSCETINDSSKNVNNSSSSNSESQADENGSNSDSSAKDSDKASDSIKDGVYTTDNYSIELGSEWTKNNSASDNDVTVFSSTNSNGKNVNINIRQEHYHDGGTKNIDFDQYKESIVDQFKSMDGYKVTDTEDVKIDGNDAFKIYINMKSTKIEMLQCYIIDSEHIFTYSFLTNSKDFDSMKEDAEKILESFKTL